MNAERLERGLIALPATLPAIAPLAATAEELPLPGCSE